MYVFLRSNEVRTVLVGRACICTLPRLTQLPVLSAEAPSCSPHNLAPFLSLSVCRTTTKHDPDEYALTKLMSCATAPISPALAIHHLRESASPIPWERSCDTPRASPIDQHCAECPPGDRFRRIKILSKIAKFWPRVVNSASWASGIADTASPIHTKCPEKVLRNPTPGQQKQFLSLLDSFCLCASNYSFNVVFEKCATLCSHTRPACPFRRVSSLIAKDDRRHRST